VVKHSRTWQQLLSAITIAAELFAATFWSFPREFWTLDERLRCGKFSVSFQRTAKHTIIGLCPQRLALNADTTIVFETLFRRLVT
jgi:hypothetical protein